jgi:hypothetical protein
MGRVGSAGSGTVGSGSAGMVTGTTGSGSGVPVPVGSGATPEAAAVTAETVPDTGFEGRAGALPRASETAPVRVAVLGTETGSVGGVGTGRVAAPAGWARATDRAKPRKTAKRPATAKSKSRRLPFISTVVASMSVIVPT